LPESIYFGEGRTQRLWRFWILLVAGSTIVTLALFAHTAWDMAAQWYGSQTFGHGFLVLPISLCLIWLKRDEVSRCELRPLPLVLVLLAMLAALWLLARLALAPVGEEFALVAMFPTLVWLLLGSSVARRLLFPLLFLFFMVPVGDFLVPLLQGVAAWIAAKGLELVRVPVILEGHLISVPSGAWEVAEACSGLRYLIASLVLACLFANVVYTSRRRQLIFVVSSLIFSVVANGVRVFGIVLLGQLVSMKVASGVDHLIYGWIVFTFIIAVLFSVGWRCREPGKGEFAKLDSVIPASDAAEIGGWNRSAPPTFLGAALAAVALLLLISTSASAHWLDRPSQVPALLLRPTPLVLPPWRPAGGYADTWKPQFRGAASQLFETYSDGARQVYLFVAYYTHEQAEATLVSNTNALVNPGWMVIENGRARSALDGKPGGIAENVIQGASNRRLVWSCYWVDGQFTDNPYRAKLRRVKALLLGEPRASAFVAVASDYVPDRSAAAQTLQDFLAHATFGARFLHASQ
jgi:exosortase A